MLGGGEEEGEVKKAEEEEECQAEKGDREGEDSIEELCRKISMDEMQRALRKMKNGKAEGENGIAIEFFKNLPRI